ncbi:sensor histidine kinase [Pedobacter jeongneungensis]
MIFFFHIFFRKYWIHILVWTLFIIYEAIVVGLISGIFSHPITYTCHYVLILILFYSSSAFLLPRCVKGNVNAIWTIPLFYSLLIASYILCNYFLESWLVDQNFITHINTVKLNKEFILRILHRSIYILGFSTAYYFLMSYLEVSRSATELEKQRLLEIIKNERTTAALKSAENSFLRAQINPHFLFNTLGYIHYHINKHSKEAADAIIQLSDVMRYAINVDDKETQISIITEMAQIEKLFCLQQMRRKNLMNISIYIEEEAEQILFIPMVLLTLAENMVKHGDFSERESPAVFSVTLNHNTLRIFTRNLINQSPSVESSGQGIKNIATRLQYTYGEEAKLSSRITGECFELEIICNNVSH